MSFDTKEARRKLIERINKAKADREQLKMAVNTNGRCINRLSRLIILLLL